VGLSLDAWLGLDDAQRANQGSGMTRLFFWIRRVIPASPLWRL
jgi:hypothetical protein